MSDTKQKGRWWPVTLKYAKKCCECGYPMRVGQKAQWNRTTHKAKCLHSNCAKVSKKLREPTDGRIWTVLPTSSPCLGCGKLFNPGTRVMFDPRLKNAWCVECATRILKDS